MSNLLSYDAVWGKLKHLNAELDQLNVDITARRKEEYKYLSGMLNIAMAGGNIFDYYLDRGIKDISVYGDSDILGYLREFAYSSDINVRHWMSDNGHAYYRAYPYVIKFERAASISSIDDLDSSEAILMAQGKDKGNATYKLLSQRFKDVTLLYDAMNYALDKNTFIKQLNHFSDTHPNLTVMYCCVPVALRVQNPTDNERYVVKNVRNRDILDNINQHKTVVDQVFRSHNLSDDYIKEVITPLRQERRSGLVYLEDRTSPHVNVVNGMRMTTDLPPCTDNAIYMFGNSFLAGHGSDDTRTVNSYLQRAINAHVGHSYSVFNYANTSGLEYNNIISLMNSMPYQDGDIVICAVSPRSELSLSALGPNVLLCEASRRFDRPHDKGEVFYEKSHVNHVGSQMVSEAIFDTLREHHLMDQKQRDKPLHQDKHEQKTTLQKPEYSLQALEQLEKYQNYLRSVRRPCTGQAGAIVMNCNPFTLGHQYLIEKAAKEVDQLYIFVVEEDKSFFPFADRIDLVKKGVAHLDNVTVLPSGKFIISSITFEMYFEKESLVDKTIDPSYDILTFANYIAPELGITRRFVGDEPLCPITRQYNSCMKHLLPQYGIELIVFERKEEDAEPISASWVRRLLKDKNFEEIFHIVPPTTLEYLIKHF